MFINYRYKPIIANILQYRNFFWLVELNFTMWAQFPWYLAYEKLTNIIKLSVKRNLQMTTTQQRYIRLPVFTACIKYPI